MEKLKFIAKMVSEGYVRGNYSQPWELEVKVNGEPIDLEDLYKLEDEYMRQMNILRVVGRHIYNGALSGENIDSNYGKLSYVLTIY